MSDIQRMVYRVQDVMMLGEDASVKTEWVGKWQTTPPTVPGVYWYAEEIDLSAHGFERIKIYTMRIIGDIAQLRDGGQWVNLNMNAAGHWLGPLPEPEMPQ